MEEQPIQNDKPNLDRTLFWDQRYDDIEWRAGALGVIERVLKRGDEAEYEELIRFYGRDRIIHALTKEYCVLPNFMLAEVAGYFGLKKEDLTVYKRRQKIKYKWL
jgi:hypothetical protein